MRNVVRLLSSYTLERLNLNKKRTTFGIYCIGHTTTQYVDRITIIGLAGKRIHISNYEATNDDEYPVPRGDAGPSSAAQEMT